MEAILLSPLCIKRYVILVLYRKNYYGYMQIVPAS